MLKHLRKGTIYSLRPGDVVVVTVPCGKYPRLDREVHAACKRIFPEGVKVIVKADDISLKVIRKKKL